MSSSNQSVQIAIIDRSVEGYHSLVSAAEAHGMEVILLSGTGDGFIELAEALNGRSGVDGLHLFSHGSPGNIHLGQSVLHSNNLDHYRAVLESIGQSLAAGGDLLIYGCDVAGTDAGVEFARQLSAIVGADVAASDDPTGSAVLGGDWELEVKQGSIESAIAPDSVALQDFQDILQFTGTFTFASAPTSGAAQNADSSINAKYTKNGYTLVVDGQNLSTLVYAGAYAFFGGFADGSGTQESKVTVFFENNKTFSLTSLDINNFLSASTSFVFSSDLGGSVTTASLARYVPTTVNFSGANWEGISKLYITGSGGAKIAGDIDNLVLSVGGVTNNPPVFTSGSTVTISESAANGSTVLDVNANDGDGGASDANVTYSIVSGNPNKDADANLGFAIDSKTGVITVNDTDDIDYETATSHTLVIRATDTQNASTDQSITIYVSDDEADNPPLLNAGDMVVLGWNALNDTITFATLVDLPSGTVIKVTDKGWNQATNAFTTSETGDGVITWTVSNAIGAGAVFDLYLGGSDDTTTLINRTSGNISLTSDISVSTYTVADPMILTGDGVFIYQGSDNNPFFIFGMNNSAGTVDGNNWNTSIAATLRDSMLPNGTGSQNSLVNGVNAIGLPGSTNQQDNVQYTGPTSATDKATWLARVSDSSNWTGDDTGAISTTAANEVVIGVPLNAPTVIATGSNPTFTENGAAADLFSSVTAATNDDGQTFSGMTLTVTNVSNGAAEVLSVAGTTIALVNNNSGTVPGIGNFSVNVTGSTATVVLTGMTRSDAQMGTLIDGITYSNSSDAPGTSNRVITITQITDSGGSNNSASPNLTSTVTVVAVNDAPTATNLTQSLTKNQSELSLALNDIVVSDADGVDTITATLTLSDVSAGSLSTGTFGSATSTFNAGTGVWSVTGSISDVNSALEAVAFTRNSNWTQNFTITTRVRDAADTGPADGTISISVADNVAPRITTIVRQTPSADVTNADTLTWRVTFNESVEDVDASDFQVSGKGFSPVGISSVTSAGGNAYDITLTGGIFADMNDTVTLSFADAQNITDAEGNALSNFTPISTNQNTFVLDNKAPELSGSTSTPADNGLVTSLSKDLILKFNEDDAIKVGTGQIVLKDLTNNKIVETFDVQSSASITLSGDSLTINPTADLLPGTRYSVQIEQGAITDRAGNVFAGILNDTDYNIETAPLVVLSVDSTSIAEAGGVATITASLQDANGNTVLALEDVTVTLHAPSGTATKDSDYTLSSNTITISKGSSSGTVTVTGIDDGLGDNAETVILPISIVTNGFEKDAQEVTITLIENTPPVVDLNGAEGAGTGFTSKFTEDGDAVLIAGTVEPDLATINDPDGDNIHSMTVTLSARPNGDATESLALNAAATKAASGLTVKYTESTGVLSITGEATAAVYQSILHGVTYNNLSQAPNTTARTINVVVNDGTSNSAAAVATVQVVAVNDAPVLDATQSPALLEITEDLAAPSGSNTANSTLVSTLLAGMSDVDASSKQGIAIVATNTTDGTLWHYTGFNWSKVTNASDTNAVLLRDIDRVYWQPAANKNGTVSDAFTFRAWDQSNSLKPGGSGRDVSTNGGSTAYSTTTDTVSVTVTAVNDAPTLSVATTALTGVNEDTTTKASKVSDLLTTLGFADVDGDTGGIAISSAEGSGDWQYSTDGSNWFDVAAVDSSASLLLDVSSFVRYVPDSKNGENASFALRAWDGSVGTATKGAVRGTDVTTSNGGTAAYSAQSATVTVAVSDVNDAPTISKGATFTMSAIDEDSTSAPLTVSKLLSDTGYNDVDTGAVSGIALTGQSGNGGWEYSSDTGKTWSSINGVASDSALLLTSDAQLRYTGDSIKGETATLSYRAWDQTSGVQGTKADVSTNGGATAFSTDTGTVSLKVTDVNDRPTLDASKSPLLTTIAEDAAAPQNGVTTGTLQGATLISALLEGPSDIDGDVLGVAITAVSGEGNLYFSTDTGKTWTAAAGIDADNALLLSGSSLVYFQPAANKNGTISDALTFRVWDATTGEGAGEYFDPTSMSGHTSAFSEVSDTVSLSITPVNDAPTITDNDVHVLTGTDENTTSSATLVSAILAGVEQADVDADAAAGIAVTGVNAHGQWQYSIDGNTWTGFPTVSASAALLLSAATQIRYVPDSENGETASLSFRAWDQTSGTASGNGNVQTADTSTHGGSSAFSAQSAAATLAVSNVNDAPVLDASASPELALINEDLAAPTKGSTASSTLVSALLGGVSDVDNNAQQGIAVVASNNTEGTLWFSTDNGSSWTQATGVTDSNALLLRSTDRVYWQPAENKNGSVNDALTFRAWDQSEHSGAEGSYKDASATGGATAFSIATDTASVSVSAVNDAPTLKESSTALAGINEDTTTTATKVSDLLTTLGFADVDGDTGGIAINAAEGSGDWQYSTDGSNWFDVATVDSSASLLLDASSFVRYVPDSKNGENASFALRAWDGSVGTATKGAVRGTDVTTSNGGAAAYSTQSATVTVAVSDVNDAPTITDAHTFTMTGITEDQISESLYVNNLLTAASYADVDTGAVSGIAITGVSGNGLWEYTTHKTWTSINSVSDASALLLTPATRIRYTGDQKSGETATLTYRAWDQTSGSQGSMADTSTNGGTTAFSGQSGSISLVVSDVNDAPVLDTSGSPVLSAILEDAAAPQNGVTLGSAQGATSVSSLTGGITDVDNATPGIAITSKAAGGTLWFSTSAGATWTAASAVSDSSALLLRATDLVYYQPAANANGELDVLSFRAWDTSSGSASDYIDTTTNGGASAYSTAIETVTVSVGAVNDAPTLSATGAEGDFVENDKAISLFSSASISTGPADESAQTLSELTLTVSGLHDGADELLVIDGSELALTNGNIVTTADNSLSVSVSVTGGTATVTLSGAALSSAQMQTLIQSIAYRNSSENPDETDRVITLTSIKDSGGTANNGVDSTSLNIASTVKVQAVNDAPTGAVTITGAAVIGSTLTITQNLADLDGLGMFSYIWKADDVVLVDQTSDKLSLNSGNLLNKVITATITYTDGGGTAESVTSKATSAVADPAPTGSNVDGATVTQTTGSAPDGTPVNVTVIGIVGDEREEQTGESELANIPLVTDANNNTLLEVGLPSGTGMRIESANDNSDTNGRDGLIAAIRARTQNAPQDQLEMTGVGSSFLDDLPDQGNNLIVRTLIPSVPAGTTQAPAQAIKISAPPVQVGDRPVATVIDVRGLPSGTVIQLENVQFVAIVGDVTMTGGEGAQVVTGDGGRQIIVLGADDDIIRGGAGDDFIGSRGGDDRLYGDEGNDHLVGGAGNDHLEGGDGNDVLQGGASDAGTWQFSLVDGELVSRFVAAQPLGADAETLSIVGPWWTEVNNTGRETDNRLQFTYESAERLQLVATLYKAAVGERAGLMEFNEFTTSGLSELQLSQAAVDHWFNAQGLMPQAIQVQVAMLINAVWGSGAATDDLIAVGSEFISGGGSWAEGMLILAKAVEAQQLLANPNGDLVLVKDLLTSETGRNQPDSGNDTLLGGAGNDRLVGGGGNNFLDGGEGTDVAVYTGAPGDFTFQIRVVNGQTQMVLTTEHTGGVDVLQNIELLKIGAYYYALPESLNALAPNTDHALENHLVQLTAQQVIAMDLAGIY